MSDRHFDAQALVRASLGMGGNALAWTDGPHGARLLLAPDVTVGADVPGVLALGAFDGFHLGHRALMEAALADARARGVRCLAIMFDPDPDELFLGDDAPRQLLSCENRARLIASAGVDGVIMLRFDHALAALEPTAFVERVLCQVAKPASIHVGSNFRFGARGAGDCACLRACGAHAGFEVVAHELVERGGKPVSSTRIRAVLAEPAGLAEANDLLGRCHFLSGVVEHGRGEGTSFGFPTANVRFPGRSCMPAQGVYGGYVTIGDAAWPAAINVGAPPTFSGPDELFCEANLIGFAGDVYGAKVAVTFVEWLRASRPFGSTEELERVVLGNIDWVRTNLGDGRVEVALDN